MLGRPQTEPAGAATLPARRWGMQSWMRNSLSELWRDRVGFASVSLFALIVLVAAVGPLLLSASPTEPSLIDRLTPPAWQEGGSWAHPLGTDALGRDMLSRLVYSARASLIVGAAVVIIAGTAGIFAGLMAGYRGGWLGSAIMRLVDTQVAFPGLLLALLILSILGASLKMVVIVLAINGWMVYARMTYSIVLSLKEAPYVQAAETIGCPPRRIVWRYLLPNLSSPLLTLATLEFARIVLAEASLSYLGLGIQPPGASWGLMVAEGQEYLTVAWWAITFPGLAIALTVLTLNLMASWLRVITDPQQREKRFVGAASTGGGAA